MPPSVLSREREVKKDNNDYDNNFDDNYNRNINSNNNNDGNKDEKSTHRFPEGKHSVRVCVCMYM